MTTVTPSGATIEDTSGPSRVRRFTAGERLLDVVHVLHSEAARVTRVDDGLDGLGV